MTDIKWHYVEKDNLLSINPDDFLLIATQPREKWKCFGYYVGHYVSEKRGKTPYWVDKKEKKIKERVFAWAKIAMPDVSKNIKTKRRE